MLESGKHYRLFTGERVLYVGRCHGGLEAVQYVDRKAKTLEPIDGKAIADEWRDEDVTEFWVVLESDGTPKIVDRDEYDRAEENGYLARKGPYKIQQLEGFLANSPRLRAMREA